MTRRSRIWSAVTVAAFAVGSLITLTSRESAPTSASGCCATGTYGTSGQAFAAAQHPASAAVTSNAGPVPSLRIAPPAISAASAVVMDVGTGAILYTLHPDRPMPPASLTKIATALVAIDSGRLNDWVTVRPDIDSLASDSSLMGLQPGDRFRLSDLLYGLMLPSGNDAAVAIADAVAGSQTGFVARMNALARRLGLRETVFADSHGLGAEGIAGRYGSGARSAWAHRMRDPDGIAGVAPSPPHVSSARDIALLARAALARPEIAMIADTRTWVAHGSRDIEMWNTNSLLWDYPGANGLKTGYTEEAGRTLAATVTRGGHRADRRAARRAAPR